MTTTRINTILAHLRSQTVSVGGRPVPESSDSQSIAHKSLDRHRDGVSAMSQPSADAVVANLRNAVDLFEVKSEQAQACSGEYDFISLIPGPLHDVGPGKTYKDKMAIIWELADAAQRGCNHIVWESYTRKCVLYCMRFIVFNLLWLFTPSPQPTFRFCLYSGMGPVACPQTSSSLWEYLAGMKSRAKAIGLLYRARC
jgi:hypothetical protein